MLNLATAIQSFLVLVEKLCHPKSWVLGFAIFIASVTSSQAWFVSIASPQNRDTVKGQVRIFVALIGDDAPQDPEIIVSINGANSERAAFYDQNLYVVPWDTTFPQQNGTQVIEATVAGYERSLYSDVNSVFLNQEPSLDKIPSVKIVSPEYGDSVLQNDFLRIFGMAEDDTTVYRVGINYEGGPIGPAIPFPQNPFVFGLTAPSTELTSYYFLSVNDVTQQSISRPVKINTLPHGSTLPELTIVEPRNGQTFQPGNFVHIHANLTNMFESGEVHFYIGEEREPILSFSGSPPTNLFGAKHAGSLNVPPGPHFLRARVFRDRDRVWTSAQPVLINILDVNRPPTDLMVSASPLIVHESQEYVLNASAYDPDGSDGNLGFFWSQVFGPGLSVSNDANTVMQAPAVDEDSLIIFDLTVTDQEQKKTTLKEAVTILVRNIDESPPSVIVSHPIAGQTVTGPIALEAVATDTESNILYVTFLENGHFAGHTDVNTNDVFTVNWTPTINGARNIQAITEDAAGNSGISPIVTVNVDLPDTTPPDVEIRSPIEGTLVRGPISILAYAHDSESSIDRVEFFVNSQSIGDGVAGPGDEFTKEWEPQSDGDYELTATAIDKEGNSHTSESVFVQADVLEISEIEVTVSSPVAGSTISGHVDLSAQVVFPEGVTARILTFEINGVNVGSDLNGEPYEISWDSINDVGAPSNGYHELTATFFFGTELEQTIQRVTSDPIGIFIFNDLEVPTVSITAPTDGEQVGLSKSIVVKADDDTGIIRVDFYVDDKIQFSDSEFPFIYEWDTTLESNQNHTLTAVAYDRAGKSTLSDPISVIVENPLSEGTITPSPLNFSFVTNPGPVEISASFDGILPDEGQLTPTFLPRALKVFCTRDNSRIQLPGIVTYSAIGTGVLRFNGNIPENCLVDWVVHVPDKDRRILAGVYQFIRPVSPNNSAVVNSPDGQITLDVSPDSLPEDVYITIQDGSDDLTSNQPLNESPNMRIIAGPYDIVALNKNGDRIYDLKVPAKLRFARPAANIPPDEQGQVLQIQDCGKNLGVCQPLNFSESLSSQELQPQQSIQLPISRFSSFQIVSFFNLNQPIAEFFNFPNPFSPDEGGTRFRYVLGENSEVTFVIYDLFGNLVNKFSFPAGSENGQANLNQFIWDGRNGEGKKISNGGYLVHVFVEDINGNKARIKHKVLVVR